LSPGGTRGIAFAALGPVFRLSPDGTHAAGIRFSALAIQGASRPEIAMDAYDVGFGTITPNYRMLVGNHVAEVALKLPLVWATFHDDSLHWLESRPPLILSAGFGY
jgi:hypothetical protein